MKKLLVFIFLLFLSSAGTSLSENFTDKSFMFLERELVFGSSLENFLNLYPEFKVNDELSSGNESVAAYIVPVSDCELTFNVYFTTQGLNKFELHSNCNSEEKEGHIIKSITSQFKLIPSKDSDEEEMGDIMQTYKKGKLKAEEFIGGFYMLTIEKIK